MSQVAWCRLDGGDHRGGDVAELAVLPLGGLGVQPKRLVGSAAVVEPGPVEQGPVEQRSVEHGPVAAPGIARGVGATLVEPATVAEQRPVGDGEPS